LKEGFIEMWGECRIRSLRLAKFDEKVNAKKIDLTPIINYY